MSGPPPESRATPEPAPDVPNTPDTSAARTPLPRSAVNDALITLVWFFVAGLVGALLWWAITPLPEVTKTAEGAVYDNETLTSQVAIDGWFFVIAAVGGLVSGVVLLSWRSRHPVRMVLLVVVGAGLASWLMIRVGLILGPGEETAALSGKPNGSKAPMQLDLHATGVAWLWPMGAALGALVQLWVLRKDDGEPAEAATVL